MIIDALFCPFVAWTIWLKTAARQISSQSRRRMDSHRVMHPMWLLQREVISSAKHCRVTKLSSLHHAPVQMNYLLFFWWRVKSNSCIYSIYLSSHPSIRAHILLLYFVTFLLTGHLGLCIVPIDSQRIFSFFIFAQVLCVCFLYLRHCKMSVYLLLVNKSDQTLLVLERFWQFRGVVTLNVPGTTIATSSVHCCDQVLGGSCHLGLLHFGKNDVTGGQFVGWSPQLSASF